MKKFIFGAAMALAGVNAFAVDALNGAGLFSENYSVEGWAMNPREETAVGVAEPEWDIDDNYGVKLWVNYSSTRNVWDVQTYYPMKWEKGYSYTINMGFSSFDTRSAAPRSIVVGVQHNGGDYDTYMETTFTNTTGDYQEFSSTTIKNCDLTDLSARFFINGGVTTGGAKIAWAAVDKQPISCGTGGSSTGGDSDIGGGSTGGGTTGGSSITLNPDRQVDGPVSMYGRLQAGTNSSGQGRIFGSCPAWNNNPVKVRGMSLFWSMDGFAEPFYSASMVDAMVKNMKIEVIRFAMSTDGTDWGGFAAGYGSAPTAQKNKIDEIVKAAVKNDIYVIIDWHSHMAHTETAAATAFFGEMAQKYGKLNNVIFEIYNEPACTNHEPWGMPEGRSCAGNTSWSTIKTYATSVIAAIRKYSDNLIVVGTPSWSSDLSGPNTSPINDKNVAYTYHFYATEHTQGSHNSTATTAIRNGRSVFVTEWGTCMADGDGGKNKSRPYYTEISETANNSWNTWLNTYDLSAANWSASVKPERCSAFATSNKEYGSLTSGYYYTYSGSIVKNNIVSHVNRNVPNGYTACSGATEGSGMTPSNPVVASSNSNGGGSSSSRPSSSNSNGGSSSNSGSPAEKIEISGSWVSGNGVSTGSTDRVVVGSSVNGVVSIDVDVRRGRTYVVQFDASTAVSDGVLMLAKVNDLDGEQIAKKNILVDRMGKFVSLMFESTYTGPVTIVLQTKEVGDVVISDFAVEDLGKTSIMANVSRKSLVSISGNRLNVMVPNGSDVKVQIFDMMGHLVMDKALGSSVRTQVSVENLSRGNYVVKVSGNGFAPSVTQLKLK